MNFIFKNGFWVNIHKWARDNEKLIQNSAFVSLKRPCNPSRDSLQSVSAIPDLWNLDLLWWECTILQSSSQQTRSYFPFNINCIHIQMKRNRSSKAGQQLLTLSYGWLWASVCRYRLAHQECGSSATANTRLCKYFQHGYELYDSDRAFQQCFYRCNHTWLVSWKREPVICYFFTVCGALKPVRLLASCKSELGPSVSICEQGNKGLFVSLNHSCSWKQTLSKKKKLFFFSRETL